MAETPIFVNEDDVFLRRNYSNALFFNETFFAPGVIYASISPIFVNEDVVFHRPDYARFLMFGRITPVSTAGQPFSLLKNTPPPWNLFEDKFASVYSVAEIYGTDQALAPPGNPVTPFAILTRKAFRNEEFVEEYKRFNHQVYFQTKTGFAPQMVGYTFEQPDFNDHPWLEPLPPPKNAALSLLPFRGIPTFIRGQQYSFLFYKGPNWNLEAEPDKIRAIDHNARLIMYGRPKIPFLAPQPPIILDIYEIARGMILLVWNGNAGTYDVQLNGVVIQTLTGFNTIISGLLVDTDYLIQIVERATFTTAPVLSNDVHYEYGSKEEGTITYMRRIKPFPSTGYN